MNRRWLRFFAVLIALLLFATACRTTTTMAVRLRLDNPSAQACYEGCRQNPGRRGMYDCLRRCPGADENRRDTCRYDERPPAVACEDEEVSRVSPGKTAGLAGGIVGGVLLGLVLYGMAKTPEPQRY